MKRRKTEDLLRWKGLPDRRPLIVRGARQVGKTWLVREAGKRFGSFVEFNFEREPALTRLFERQRDPRRLVHELSAVAGQRIRVGETLVFFDEVQQSPPALASIRYFYEELRELHVVAAGSLLNMVLDEIPTGVGRVSYLNLYPMSFSEFLDAAGEGILVERIRDCTMAAPLEEIHHEKLLGYVKRYMLLGGMPAVLDSYFGKGDILRCQELQSDILQSFLDDFNRYSRKMDVHHLASVLRSVPLQLGCKFKYARVDPSVKSTKLSVALDMLEMAGLVHRVYHSSADGIPVGSRIRLNRFKVIFFDTGLAQRLLNVDLGEWMTMDDIRAINRGPMAEQYVGQELAANLEAGSLHHLTYWHREARGSTAEVDYLLEAGKAILPVEVKQGSRGGMKSLHLFLEGKRQRHGIKVSRHGFGLSSDGKVLSVPLYAVDWLFRGRLNEEIL